MTLTLGSFSCTKCKTVFNEEYEPSIRPRRSCPKCHKPSDLTPKKRDTSDKKERSKSPPKNPFIPGENIKITMENAEDLIMNELSKNPTVPVLRLMVDFLKIKQLDKSELEEIDLEIFYKKSLEEEIINE